MKSTRVAIQPNNQLALPKDLTSRLGWRPGHRVYIYRLDDSITIRAKPSAVLEAAQEFESIMEEERVVLKDLLVR